MDWEEELILRNRKLNFDEKFIYKLTIEISNKLKKYCKRYKVNLNIYCVPGNYINIIGKHDIKIHFITKKNLLVIKLNDPNAMYIEIKIMNYLYSIKYKNTDSKYKAYNRSVYFLDNHLFSELLKDLLIINNKF